MKPVIQYKKLPHLTAGYSLVELILAMAIGVVALSATLGMYVNYKNGVRTTENTLTMQTNARFAFSFIANNLRDVGSMGCRSNRIVADGDTVEEKMLDDSFIALADKTNPDFHFGRDVEGYDAAGTGWIPAPDANYLPATMTPGSDAIKITGAMGAIYNTTGAEIKDTDTQVQLNMAGINRVDLVSGGYASISTCKAAQIFQVTSSDGEIQAGIIKRAAGGNERDDFAANEPTNTAPFFAAATGKSSGAAEVRRMAVIAYFVAENDAGIPTLYRSVDGNSTPLVTGVEKMQIEYGVNTKPLVDRNVANVYLDAQQVAAGPPPISWGNVVSVRISLTMRSYDPVYDTPLSGKIYSMPLTNGSTDDYVSNDRFARYTYTSTVVLRNRIIGDRT